MIIDSIYSDERCIKPNDLIYLDDAYVDIGAKGSLQRVPWKDMSYTFLAGNSFACANVTGIISQFAMPLSLIKVRQKLKQRSILPPLMQHKRSVQNTTLPHMPTNAVIFPFNKEMHSLIRFEELLRINIIDVYDVKFSGNVGRYPYQVLNMPFKSQNRIKDIQNLDWDSFDTIIIGHCYELSYLLQGRFNWYELISNLQKKHKFIYSFEDISDTIEIENRHRYFTPKITKEDVYHIPYGKLFRHMTPTVCVCGTGPKQGKFSLQLQLRKLFLQDQYKVGQIGTEPTAYLFGMDECFHYGFHHSNSISRHETIEYINHKTNEISQSGVDIIIGGTQSGMITSYEGNLNTYPLGQYEFILGLQPDLVILCVNADDGLNCIKRTINFIEGGVDCHVIGLVIFPLVNFDGTSGYYGKKRELSEDEFSNLCCKFYELFRLPVYRLGEPHDMNKMYLQIINCLSSGGTAINEK